MSEDLRVPVVRRDDVGTSSTRRLRASGRVPANVYGQGKAGASVSVATDVIEQLVATRSSVVDVELDGSVDKAVVQEIQWDVFSTYVQHIDFRRVDPDGRTTVDVTLELRGEPVGLKDGGLLRQAQKTVTITCPDFRVPRTIAVRIGSLKVGDAVRAGDLTLPEHSVLVSDPSTLIAEVYDPRKAG